MERNTAQETMVEQKVTYVIEIEGRIVVIENVPARVCLETGERFFAPETVERLQQMIWEDRKPTRIVEAAVFEYAA